MPHSVTIRTQTTRSTSTGTINSGYLKTWGGIVKLLQLTLGTVCVGIIGHHISVHTMHMLTAELFFFAITITFLIGTFINFVSCLASFSTSSILPKTIYELLYHSIACGLYLAASITYLLNGRVIDHYVKKDLVMAAAICGLVNAGLYLLFVIISIRSYGRL